jgi:hypothetical protein
MLAGQRRAVSGLPRRRRAPVVRRRDPEIGRGRAAERGQVGALPLRVVAPFNASLVMVVTSLDATDAREICRTLEVTEDPQCWRRTIRERFPGVLQ